MGASPNGASLSASLYRVYEAREAPVRPAGEPPAGSDDTVAQAAAPIFRHGVKDPTPVAGRSHSAGIPSQEEAMRRSRLTVAACLTLLAVLIIPTAALRAGRRRSPTSWSTRPEHHLGDRRRRASSCSCRPGFLFLEIGFSRGKNVGTVVAKILTNFSISSIVWWACGFAIAFGGAAKLAGDSGFFFQYGSTISSGGLVDGHGGRQQRGVLLLPVRLLRRLAGDRLGHDARAHQVHRVPDLRGRLLGDHLPADRPLDLRRRLPRRPSATACRTSPARRWSTSPVRPARSPRCCCSARARASTARTASRARSPATTCRCSASAS